MRFYNSQHQFYCGIDLHARTMHVCILDRAGCVVLDRNLACHFQTLLEAIAPFRDGIVIGVECMFGENGDIPNCSRGTNPGVAETCRRRWISRADRQDALRLLTQAVRRLPGPRRSGRTLRHAGRCGAGP
jgi:hypothetical protein